MKVDHTLTGNDLFRFLVQNKKALIAEKKYEVKRGDAISFCGSFKSDNGSVMKANAAVEGDPTEIQVTSVINTTYWLDSHGDVHIDNLWSKSLSEIKDLYLLEEHKMTFRGIISDSVTASTQKIAWKTLGIDFPGYTQALVFVSNVKADRNPYMFDQYRQGFVKQHSVGMRYVKIELAINQEEWKEEKAVWDKYIDRIANKDEAIERGFFWAVTEAKVVEGSAVPLGSNAITPTRSVKNSEPSADTHTVPQKRTRVKEELNKLLSLTKSVK